MHPSLKLFLIYLCVSILEAAALYAVVLGNVCDTLAMTYVLYAGLAIVLAMTVRMSKLTLKTVFKIPLFYLLLVLTMLSFSVLDNVLLKMMGVLFTMLDGLYVLYLNHEKSKHGDEEKIITPLSSHEDNENEE